MIPVILITIAATEILFIIVETIKLHKENKNRNK